MTAIAAPSMGTTATRGSRIAPHDDVGAASGRSVGLAAPITMLVPIASNCGDDSGSSVLMVAPRSAS
jgi:hypothetical protein